MLLFPSTSYSSAVRCVFAIAVLLLYSRPVDGFIIDGILCIWSARNIIPLVFNYRNYDRYAEYFREDSVLSFVQGGDYVGPDDIAEYIQIVDSQYNPYLTSGADISFPWFVYQGYDQEEGQCIFRLFSVVRMEGNSVYNTEAFKTKATVMFKFFLDQDGVFAARTNAFFHKGVVEQAWGVYQNNDKSRELVCSVANEVCSGYLDFNPNCEEDMKALDPTEGDFHYIDGNTQGCRMLHSVFAQTNPENHCPYISITPLEDPKGRIKCQESAGRVPLDLFDEKDLEEFNTYSRLFGVDPDVGFVSSYQIK